MAEAGDGEWMERGVSEGGVELLGGEQSAESALRSHAGEEVEARRDGEPLASLSVARSVGRAAMGQSARGRAEYAAVDVTRWKTR